MPSAEQTPLSRQQALTVFATLALALALAFLDQNLLSTALPSITAGVDGGAGLGSWIATSYLVAQAAFTPLVGTSSDVMGRKPLLLLSMALFIVGSLACALSKTMLQLILFRAVQGMGGGGIVALVNVIMSDVVSPRSRGRYQSWLEVVTLLTSAVGPALGGALADGPGWRYCFWINLPIGAVSFLVTLVFLPFRTAPKHVVRKLATLDWTGAVLMSGSTVMIMLALSWGGVTFEWTDQRIIGCFIGGVVGLGVFGGWEWKVAGVPIVPLAMLRNRTANITFFCSLFIGAQFGVLLYYIPQLLQITRGQSAVLSGAVVVPALGATSSAVVVLAGQVQSRTGRYKFLVVGGFALSTISMGLLSRIDETSSIGEIIGYTIMAGAGQGAVVKTSMVGLQAAVTKDEMAVATAVRYYFRMQGTALGLTAANAILSNSLNKAADAAFLSREVSDAVLKDPLILHDAIKLAANPALAVPGVATQLIAGYADGFSTIFKMMIAAMGVCFIASALAPEIDLGEAGEVSAPPAPSEEESQTVPSAGEQIPLERLRSRQQTGGEVPART